MDTPKLNIDAHRENVRALMAAANIPEEEADARLSQRVLITFDRNDQAAQRLVRELHPILSKTLCVDLRTKGNVTYSVELVIGRAQTKSSAQKVFSVLRNDRLIVSASRIQLENCGSSYPLLVLISACYLAGAVIGCAIGEGIPNLPPPELEIPFDGLARVDYSLIGAVPLGEAYLAGAGAIGNGFLWAARHASLQGLLHVADKDTVSGGNRQRQIWFEEEDIGKYKAEVLCERAQPYVTDLRLEPFVGRLQEHKNRFEGPWLSKLIVGVDSRRARRQLQNEFPGEIFDASTTGSAEIVLHHNKQPLETACMSCIYYHDEQEVSFDQAVADQLGITVAEVQQQYITPEIAQRICAKHTDLQPEVFIGEAFDSLYKKLCSAEKLQSSSGKQVIAPFAFVSVLAGAMLVLEIIRRHAKDHSDPSNIWRLSPWHPPIPDLRQTLSRRAHCESCGRPVLRNIQAEFWPRTA